MAEYNFIFGAAGSGKSRYIYEWLSREASANPDKSYFLFVPEQYTLKAQREITDISTEHGMLNLDVLSFQLLFYRVAEELGIASPTVLDDIGKALLIRKAVLDVNKREGLKVYSKKISSRGFIEQIKKLISEFYQYRIDTEKLKCLAESAKSPLLRGKLTDIANIYESFTACLGEEKTVPEEINELLLKYIGRSKLLKDSVIVFDGYTGFTPVQLELLSRIMPEAKETRFVITLPKEENPYKFAKEDITDIWWLSKKSIAAVIDAASRAGVKGSDIPDIRFDKRERYSEGVFITEAEDPTEEIRALGRSIRKHAVFEDIRYQRMAVIVSDPESYKSIINREFKRAEIPFFMDDKAPALGSPAVELIRAACAMTSGSYRYDDVMRYVKNPLITVGYNDRNISDELDNYLRKTGKRGRKQLEGPESGEIGLNYVFTLEDDLKKAETAREKTDAVIGFADSIDISGRTELLAARLEENGFDKEAYECRRFSALLYDFLERIKEVLGDEKVTLDEYVKLTEAGFIDMKGSMIPETMDMVIVGDLKRSRLDDIDILYIAGANDGLLPLEVTGGGIFTDRERSEMEELGEHASYGTGFELAPDDKTDSCIQEYYLRLMMNKPNRKLIISYSVNSGSQKPLKPSGIISELLKGKAVFKRSREDEIASEEDILTLFAELIKSEGINAKTRALYKKLSADKKLQSRAELIIRGAFLEYEKDALSEKISKKLYGNILKGSVSRLETFERCPYRHFLDYGLCLKERESFDIETVDIGRLYHEVLDDVFRTAEADKKRLEDYSDQEIGAVCDRAVDNAAELYDKKVMTEFARNRFITERIRRITKKTVSVLREHLRKGDFRTFGTEIKFRFRDDNIMLSGKIDRVDWCKDDENSRTFVKVIDYKTGNTEFDINKAANGLQLQLAVYMDAAMKEIAKLEGSTENIAPAGMFYYNVSEPLIKLGDIKKSKGAENIRETAGKLAIKELRMNGAVLNNGEAAAHIDNSAGNAAETDMKSFLKNSEVVASGASAFTENGFRELIEVCKTAMHKDAKSILAGNIDVKPYRYLGEKGCDYCGYKGICGFDAEIRGYTYRRIKKLGESELNRFVSNEEKPDK